MQANNNLWQLLPLGKIASNASNSFVDGPFGSDLKSDEYTTEGVRLIQLQNIGDGEWIDDNKIFTSEKKYQELKRHAAFPGDIAIAKMADPIARACIIPPVSDRFLVVADCIKLTPDLKKYHPKFIVYAINNHSVRLQAELKSTGTTRNRINLSLLKTVNVEVPPIPEQHRIAEILDTIDEVIQKTEALISKLKAMKQGLLHDLLTRGLDKTGELRDPKAYPEQFNDSPLGRIPKEWKVDKLGEVCRRSGGSVQTGPFGSQLHAKDYKDSGIPIITVEHLGDNEIIHNNLPLVGRMDYERLERYRIETGDLVFSRVGAIDRCAYVSEQENGWLFSGRCLRVRTGGKLVNSRFLSFQLNSYESRQWILNHSVGSTMACLNTSILSEVPVSLPLIQEQQNIALLLDTHDTRIRTEEQYREKLKLQKKGLMQDLLAGKVRVRV